MNGRGHLALSIHFSLKEEDLEATRRTLDFAERASQITVDARPKVRGMPCLSDRCVLALPFPVATTMSETARVH